MSLTTDMGAVWGDSLEKETVGPSTAPAAKPAAAKEGAFPEGKVEESAPDADGIITITEWRRHPESGAKQKITRKVKRYTRVVRVPLGVTERAKWSYFGAAATEGNNGTTMKSYDDLHFEKPGEDKKSELDKFIEGGAGLASSAIVVCRHCGRVGDHYTLKCPYRDLMPAQAAGGAAPAEEAAAPTGSYVPPALRQGGAAAVAAATGEVPTDQLTRIRIGNLDEDVTEDDLRELVAQYGRVDRVSLAKHRETGKVTAAYVSFYTHDDADRARKNLDGVGFHYLVLKVDWARPNPSKDGFSGSGGLSSGFVSGYGKALPQMPGGGGGGGAGGNLPSRPMAK